MRILALYLFVIASLSSISLAHETVVFEAKQDKASEELTADETRLIELTNVERQILKLPALQADPVLVKLAREHSATMARLDKVGHDLEGNTFSKRLEQAHYQALQAGENVAQGQRSPAEAVAVWMQSPDHKANILNADYTHIGVGTAAAKSGQTYFTQAFSKPVNQDNAYKATPLEWRVLLIIKPETDLKLQGEPAISTRIPEDNINAVKQAFAEHTPYWVERVSEGRLKWKADVVISKTPVTRITDMGNKSYWLAPWDIPDDIRESAPLGKYDGVFVYWKAVNDDGKGLNAGFGWSIGPNENANFAGFSSVHYGSTNLWDRDSETTEVFLHEWQHQLEAFSSGKGVKLPKGGLHIDASYGYKHRPTMCWKPWYRDFLAGDVREPDGSRTGLGEQAWAMGTIRDEQKIFVPAFLTSEIRQRNLLRNGSFEDSDSIAWTMSSWRGDKNVGHMIDHDKAPDGRRVVMLQATQSDDAHYRQTVSGKPRTRYLFAGWARTEDITIAEKGGALGANLSVLGGFERSRGTLIGASDWTYLSFAFDSGERTSVDVAARIGQHGSTASGKAWFDDLFLIELPENSNSPVSH